jgi:hypothetical protein
MEHCDVCVVIECFLVLFAGDFTCIIHQSHWGIKLLVQFVFVTLIVISGEGFHQVMETVESGLLESDNDDTLSEPASKAVETGLFLCYEVLL